MRNTCLYPPAILDVANPVRMMMWSRSAGELLKEILVPAQIRCSDDGCLSSQPSTRIEALEKDLHNTFTWRIHSFPRAVELEGKTVRKNRSGL